MTMVEALIVGIIGIALGFMFSPYIDKILEFREKKIKKKTK